jgi:hypothetical protein
MRLMLLSLYSSGEERNHQNSHDERAALSPILLHLEQFPIFPLLLKKAAGDSWRTASVNIRRYSVSVES